MVKVNKLEYIRRIGHPCGSYEKTFGIKVGGLQNGFLLRPLQRGHSTPRVFLGVKKQDRLRFKTLFKTIEVTRLRQFFIFYFDSMNVDKAVVRKTRFLSIRRGKYALELGVAWRRMVKGWVLRLNNNRHNFYNLHRQVKLRGSSYGPKFYTYQKQEFSFTKNLFRKVLKHEKKKKNLLQYVNFFNLTRDHVKKYFKGNLRGGVDQTKLQLFNRKKDLRKHYLFLLTIKQGLRYYYGDFRLSFLKNIYKQLRSRRQGSGLKDFITYLEQALFMVVYRLNFVSHPKIAIYLMHDDHKIFYVNNQFIKYPLYQTQVGDLIGIKNRVLQKMVNRFLTVKQVPSFLYVNHLLGLGWVLRKPELRDYKLLNVLTLPDLRVLLANFKILMK